RRLDAESALPGAPEKSRTGRVKTQSRHTCGREGPQARPLPFDGLDWPIHDGLEVVDRPRHVDLLRSCVARLARRFVVRADPDPVVRFALEIELTETVDHQREVLEPAPADSQLNHGPPVWLQF